MDRQLITYANAAAPAINVVLILAHGAGAPMDSPFLEAFSARMSVLGVTVARFEFDYMAQRRTNGSKRPLPNVARLADEYRNVVRTLRDRFPAAQLMIGGKSMGGRVASMIADEMHARADVCGSICLGYPFHPPKRPGQLRTAHLVGLTCPTLIVQGDRDPLGTRSEIEQIKLSCAIEFVWISDGDHDFKPRAKSGFTHDRNLDIAAAAATAFLAARSAP